MLTNSKMISTNSSPSPHLLPLSSHPLPERCSRNISPERNECPHLCRIIFDHLAISKVRAVCLTLSLNLSWHAQLIPPEIETKTVLHFGKFSMVLRGITARYSPSCMVARILILRKRECFLHHSTHILFKRRSLLLLREFRHRCA